MATGYLDANGDPHIKLKVSGPITTGTEMDFLIDTGYQGFVSIPLVQAFPIGLILSGTTNIVMANGQPQPRLMCLGGVTCDGTQEVGLVVIESTGQTPLVGMEFLRRFNKRLVVDPVNGIVELTTMSLPVAPAAPAQPLPPDAAPTA